MRILHFYKTAFPETRGGVEQVINQIAIGSSKLGIKTDVLCLAANKIAHTVEINGYSVHRAHQDFKIASTGFSVSVFLRFYQLAKKADIIHYHFPWPFMDLVHFAVRINKPTLVTYHSDIIRQKYLLNLYRPLKRMFLRSVDCIVATSPNYFTTSDVLKKYADKVEIIPIGLDKNTYPQPQPERLQFWKEKLDSKFFLFVGVIRYYKGLHILLEAAKDTNYPIVIVGAGPIEQELKKQAAQLCLHNVIFLGYIPDDDKVALIMLCYAIVFPSHLRSEAFGVSLLEGAMYSKPMISSEIGSGTSFININGETGLVVPPSNPEALRQAMHYLWNHPEEATKMGKQAEERYRKYFTAEQMSNRYAELYKKLERR